MALSDLWSTSYDPSSFYISNLSGSTITIGGKYEGDGPVAVKEVNARKAIEIEMENSPWAVSAEEDAEGVRWVTIGCQRKTLERWRERGERYIAAHTTDKKERERLAKGLKAVLDAITKAFAAK